MMTADSLKAAVIRSLDIESHREVFPPARIPKTDADLAAMPAREREAWLKAELLTVANMVERATLLDVLRGESA